MSFWPPRRFHCRLRVGDTQLAERLGTSEGRPERSPGCLLRRRAYRGSNGLAIAVRFNPLAAAACRRAGGVAHLSGALRIRDALGGVSGRDSRLRHEVRAAATSRARPSRRVTLRESALPTARTGPPRALDVPPVTRHLARAARRGMRPRDAVGARRPRLALLRRGIPVAARVLRYPDSERDALPRLRFGSRVALSRTCRDLRRCVWAGDRRKADQSAARRLACGDGPPSRGRRQRRRCRRLDARPRSDGRDLPAAAIRPGP